jgi:hypothetical protein
MVASRSVLNNCKTQSKCVAAELWYFKGICIQALVSVARFRFSSCLRTLQAAMYCSKNSSNTSFMYVLRMLVMNMMVGHHICL